MAVYLNPKLVSISFQNLAPTIKVSKKHSERTSALMYFLAFDAAAKRMNCCPMDLNPKTVSGKHNREALTLEFVKLVFLEPASDNNIRQVATLGHVVIAGKPPEDRISSNFLTVPATKASKAAEAYNYPGRPAPLLKIGEAATGLKWGLDYHSDWRENILKFFTEMRGKAPFTDLAIFALRNDSFPADLNDVREALACVLKDRFGEDLATFWAQRMEKEKYFFKHGDEPFRDSYQAPLTESAFSAVGGASDRDALQSLDKATLIDRVVYLEGLLTAHDIEYQTN